MTPEELSIHIMKRIQARNECKAIHADLELLEAQLIDLRLSFDKAHKQFAHHDRLIASHEGRIKVIPLGQRRTRRTVIVTETTVLDPSKLTMDQAADLLARLAARMGISLIPEAEG